MVASVIIGARTEEQLRDNLGAADWSLTREQVVSQDAASAKLPTYPHAPYRYQQGFARLNPALVRKGRAHARLPARCIGSEG